MAFRALITALSMAAGLFMVPSFATAAPILTCENPQARMVHPDWFRAGGYCEIVSDLRGAIHVTRGNGAGAPGYVRIVWFDANGNQHLGDPGPGAVDVHYWLSSTLVQDVSNGQTTTYSVDPPFVGDWHYLN